MSGNGPAPLGDGAVLIEVAGPTEAAALAARLRQLVPEADEVVSGLASVVVVAPGVDLAARVLVALEADDVVEAPGCHELEVVLDGEDLDEAMAATGLGIEQVVSALTVPLRVATVGFSPGFGYLTGIAGPLAGLPRRTTPRAKVPAGSLAVAAGMAAIYPQATPGGWWLLGRASASLFDVDASPPSRLRPGDEVVLRVVTELPAAAAPRGRRALVPPEGNQAVLEVRQCPPGTMLVDSGRIGVAHLGVPAAGAADPERLAVATALVGGAPGAFEVTGSGLELAVRAPTVVAGVDLGLSVDGRPVPDGVPIAVSAGQVVSSTAVGRGGRGYLGVAGGPLVPPVLGSISTDSLAGVGPGLAPGDLLGGGPVPLVVPARGAVPEDADPTMLRVLLGPHAHLLDRSLDGVVARISATSNRVGLRLDPVGGPIEREPAEVASMPTVLGAIQLPPDGCPIILGPDRATLGGYPVVGVVASADHGALGRLAPGDAVELRVVDQQGADAIVRRRIEARAGFVVGSAPTLG
jgi:KipI family sensor histidine kinase inhibitor